MRRWAGAQLKRRAGRRSSGDLRRWNEKPPRRGNARGDGTGKRLSKSEGNEGTPVEQLRDAWDDWLLDLRRFDLDERALAKLQAVQNLLEPVLEHPVEAEQPGAEWETERQRVSDGAHRTRKQTGRHDKARAPSGYSIGRHGFLVKAAEARDAAFGGEVDARTIAAAESLLLHLAAVFEGGAVNQQQLLRNESWILPAYEELALSRGWARLRGKVIVWRESWEQALESELEMDARYRESQRLKKHLAGRGERFLRFVPPVLRGRLAGSLPSPAVGEVSGEEIRRRLQAAGLQLPSELTPTAIEEMRKRTALNSGGRAKKKAARTVVNEFVDALSNPAR